MPFANKMQKQLERTLISGSLSYEMKKRKVTGEAESDTYSNKWARDGFAMLIVQGPCFPPNDPTQKVAKWT